MAPEFFPFFAFLGLAIIALIGLCVCAVLLLSARRKRRLPVSSLLIVLAEVMVVVLVFSLDAALRRQYFLNEPLVTACCQGDLVEAQRLLSLGASVDAYGIDGTETALISASRNGCREIVELLLRQGARTDLKDNRGKTALQRAKQWRRSDIVLLLEQAERFQGYGAGRG